MDLEIALKEAMLIAGAVGVCLVDYSSGMMLGSLGGAEAGLDLEIAAAGNTEVVRAKQKTMELLNLSEKIEDILITLETHYHMMRLVTSDNGNGLFFYLALNKDQANLAMARRQLQVIEEKLSF